MRKIYKIYFSLPSFKCIGKIGRGIDMMMGKCFKRYLDSCIPSRFEREFGRLPMGIYKSETRDEKIIVSLTSFPGRIKELWICIDSLMRQTYKPDAIELWLSTLQFPDHKLPEKLTRYESKGLTIRWCDEDIRSYKKYYYSMTEHPDDCIITVDDDVYYPEEIIKNLVELHKKYPECVCANRVHVIRYDKNGEILPYRQWKHNYNMKNPIPHKRQFVTGIGGVLYPPHLLNNEVMNIAKAREICPLADDVWLNFCAYKNNVRIVCSGKYNKDLINVGATQKEKLVKSNVLSGGNDKQIKAVKEYLKIQ